MTDNPVTDSTPTILACAVEPESGAVLDLWQDTDTDGVIVWHCGNDDRSLTTCATDPDEALDTWLKARKAVLCEACGELGCLGQCGSCGAYLCLDMPHDEHCVNVHSARSEE